MPKLHILHCLDSLEVGGTELNAIRTLEHLQTHANIQVRLACFREGPLLNRLEAAGISTHRIRLRRLWGPGLAREALRLKSFSLRESIDVLHAHDRYSNFLGAWTCAFPGAPGLVVSRRWGATYDHWWERWGGRFAYRSADVVLANSPAVATSLASEENVPPAKIRVVPNFLDEEVFALDVAAERSSLRRRLDISDNALVVGCVANLRAVKGHAGVLKAIDPLARKYTSVQIVFVGEGQERAAIEALASQLHLADRVHLVGVQPEAWRWNACFDASVLFSSSEGFPNALVEAMGVGVPIVASDVGGIPDIVHHGQNGILVPAGDVNALERSLDLLLADDDLRKKLAAAGKAMVRDRYGAQNAMRELIQVYEQVRCRSPHERVVVNVNPRR